jgi:hypothetical protein
VTPKGERWLAEIGVETSRASRKKDFARVCLDWCEHRHHLSGALGTLLFDRFRELRWIAKVDDSRANANRSLPAWGSAFLINQ